MIIIKSLLTETKSRFNERSGKVLHVCRKSILEKTDSVVKKLRLQIKLRERVPNRDAYISLSS